MKKTQETKLYLQTYKAVKIPNMDLSLKILYSETTPEDIEKVDFAKTFTISLMPTMKMLSE